MKRIISLVLCLLIMTVLASCGKSPDTATSDSAATVSNNVIDPNEKVYIIHTDYCDMKYPSKWENDVKVDVTSEKVSFTSSDGNVKLFDLCFGGTDGYVYGTLTGEKPVELRVVTYEIDSKSERFEDYCVMQDNMNVILQYLIDEGKLKAD